ncbi:MAG: DUF2088 domain-containing protein, partial [Deltaproteobacteria bacterium]|nr:DUF2088 domain-containing protein [Deltaproteobacteria bacterium]
MIKSQSFFVPYGKTTLSFTAPAGVRGTLVHSNKLDPLEDVQHAISASLAAPIGAPPLRAQAGPGDRACIVFTDITRACPEYLLVPALLRELEEAGLRDEDITLLCGIGMHRPSTIEEKIFKLGASVVERYRVIDNEPGNARALVDLGVTPG